MLGIDKGADAALLLRLSNDVQREGSLAGRLGTKYFKNAATRYATDAECGIEANRAGGDSVDTNLGCGAEHHDGLVTKLGFDRGDSVANR